MIIDAPEINQVRVLGFHGINYRSEIGALFSSVVAQNLHAEFVGLVAKIIRHTLAVKRFVMNNVYGFELQILGGETCADRSLDIVTSANSVDVGIAAIGDFGCGIGRRNHRQHGVLVNLGSGKCDSGIKMTHEDQNVRISDDVPRVGYADLRLGLIVVGDKNEVKTQRLEGLRGFFHR